jgi:hypothetical protein
VGGDRLTDVQSYVSIVSNPGNSEGFNDGDLVLVNPSNKYTMLIVVSFDPDFLEKDQKVIKVEVFYAEKKPT